MPLLTTRAGASARAYGLTSGAKENLSVFLNDTIQMGDYCSGNNSYYFINTIYDSGTGIVVKRYSFDTKTISTVTTFSPGNGTWIQGFACGANFIHVAGYNGTTFYYWRGIPSGNTVTWSASNTLGSFAGVRTSIPATTAVASSGTTDLFAFFTATDNASTNGTLQLYVRSVTSSTITGLDSTNVSGTGLDATSPVNYKNNHYSFKYANDNSRTIATGAINRCYTYFDSAQSSNHVSNFAQITLPSTIGTNTVANNLSGVTGVVAVGESGKEFFYNGESYRLVCGANVLAPTYTSNGHIIKLSYANQLAYQVSTVSTNIYGDGTLVRNLGVVVDPKDGRPVIIKPVVTGTGSDRTVTMYGKKWSGSGNTYGAETKLAEMKGSSNAFAFSYTEDRKYFFVNNVCYYTVQSSPYLLALDFSGI